MSCGTNHGARSANRVIDRSILQRPAVIRLGSVRQAARKHRVEASSACLLQPALVRRAYEVCPAGGHFKITGSTSELGLTAGSAAKSGWSAAGVTTARLARVAITACGNAGRISALRSHRSAAAVFVVTALRAQARSQRQGAGRQDVSISALGNADHIATLYLAPSRLVGPTKVKLQRWLNVLEALPRTVDVGLVQERATLLQLAGGRGADERIWISRTQEYWRCVQSWARAHERIEHPREMVARRGI